MKIVTLTILLSLIFVGCGKSTKEKETENNPIEVKAKALTQEEKIAKLEKEASRLRGGGSIKTTELNDKTATIEYVKNYSEYKKLNPQSGVDKKSWELYWETSDGVEKALVDGSVRLMKKLDFLEQVQITLPYNGKTYSIDVDKESLEMYTGTTFGVITADWNKKFSDPYVYDDNGRSKFFKKFGNVK